MLKLLDFPLPSLRFFARRQLRSLRLLLNDKPSSVCSSLRSMLSRVNIAKSMLIDWFGSKLAYPTTANVLVIQDIKYSYGTNIRIMTFKVSKILKLSRNKINENSKTCLDTTTWNDVLKWLKLQILMILLKRFHI